MKIIAVVTVSILINSVFIFGQRSEPHDDLSITSRQKKALDEFKEKAISIVPHDYMKEDVYLVRWLRARDFNVKDAEEFLQKNLEWRNSTQVDAILNEDFSDMEVDFPVHVDTYDKKRQPVITAVAGHWDIRQGHLTGREKRIYRYIIRVLEQAATKVREEQQKGNYVTRFDYILNLDGFNVIQHGCPRCMLTIFEVLRSFDQHYPGMIDKIVLINAPPTLRVLFGPLVVSAVSGNTISSVDFKIIGTNKKEWQTYLFSFIDENQLTEAFGGSRVRA